MKVLVHGRECSPGVGDFVGCFHMILPGVVEIGNSLPKGRKMLSLEPSYLFTKCPFSKPPESFRKERNWLLSELPKTWRKESKQTFSKSPKSKRKGTGSSCSYGVKSSAQSLSRRIFGYKGKYLLLCCVWLIVFLMWWNDLSICWYL